MLRRVHGRACTNSQRLDGTGGTWHRLGRQERARTKSYISHILHGRMPMTDKLARDLHAKLGIPIPTSEQVFRNGVSVRTKAVRMA